MSTPLDHENYYLHPGFVFASSLPYILQTVLGSCVSVCLWDKKMKCGGMNHYIYARAPASVRNARYGDVSTPYLIKLLKDMGCEIKDLQAHIVGGAYNSDIGKEEIGIENVEVAKKILAQYNIRIVTIDTGGNMGRKIIFNNTTGEIIIAKVQKIRTDDWYEKN